MRYTLEWIGQETLEVNQLALKYCKEQIPIYRDVCEFVDHSRYLQLVTAEEIAAPTKYISIDQGQIGMICLSGYAVKYSRSWEDFKHCYNDFIAGYKICNEKLKFQLDWDEALKLNVKYDDDALIKTRRIVMDLSDFVSKNEYSAYDVYSCLSIDYPELISYTRKPNKRKTILVLYAKVCKAHIESIKCSIEAYYKATEVK